MNWNTFIEEEKKKDYFKKLMVSVNKEYEDNICYPSYDNIFHAFEMTPLDNVKVVILGQDPYHEPNQAHGLAFSVLCDKLPPSLINIYKEMESDLGIKVKQDGNLDYLARQGVLLLNTVLTVRKGEAFSHKDYGWQVFTDNVIKLLNELNQPIVFILWGSPSIKKEKLLNNPNHLVIKSAHPSPLSSYRGFFGSKPFSRTNNFLISNGIMPINWTK
ncbi:MAG: uracil-DNA glycosylase [Acholeplasmatales bacterium]|nr:uracil-DNA glycosylase [Acholeplasmatales bacterium]